MFKLKIPFPKFFKRAESAEDGGTRMFTPEPKDEKPAAASIGTGGIKRRSEDWITIETPTVSDFESIQAEAVAQIPGRTKNPNEVPGFVATMFQPLLTVVSGRVKIALDTLKSRADALKAKSAQICNAFNATITEARAELEAIAKPNIDAVRAARADKATTIARLRAEKATLPKQIADYEYGLTGDRRIRVERVLRKKLNALTAMFTSVIGGMDLLLASVVFIIAQDDTTAYVIGAAYALALGFSMHKRGVFGAQLRSNAETKETNRYWLKANPGDRGTLMPLAESVVEDYKRWTNILWGVGISMAVLRIFVAALTGKWDNFAMSFIVTLVAFGIALIGSEILMGFAPKYGHHHDVVADMKDRLDHGIDEEIRTAEAKAIPEPADLSSAKTKYASAVARARSEALAAVEPGNEINENMEAILKQEADFHGEAKTQFVTTCMSVLELVIDPETAGEEVDIKESDLLTHLQPTQTVHPFGAGTSFTALLPDFTQVPTADQVVGELEKNQPVVAPPPPPEPPPAPKPRVKINLRKA